jgi:hypothetical protein
MIEPEVLYLPYEISEEQLLKKLCLRENNPYKTRILELALKAQEIAKPKGLIKTSFIESKANDCVIIDGIEFKSRVLRVNLEEVHRVFPFVVTCGHELDLWSREITDIFESYVADVIKEMILYSASANMNPGSLPDWPINEQRSLFQLLGRVKELIGVELTESFLLIPVKSISGIRFPKEGTYENCQLCPREKCPGRKAPYDSDLYEQKYK